MAGRKGRWRMGGRGVGGVGEVGEEADGGGSDCEAEYLSLIHISEPRDA